MQRTPIVILFLALCGLLAISLWLTGNPQPVLTKSEDDIDNTIIGDSATDNHDSDGPAYMAANWSFPMPLALWNPTAGTR